MKNCIRVIIKRSGEPFGHSLLIDNTLEGLQKIVGGYIEPIDIPPNACILCNEEGKLLNLAPNFRMLDDVICGTVIVVGTNGEEFDDVPITLDEWKEILKAWGN